MVYKGLLLLALVSAAVADYDCVCNYNVEEPVRSSPTSSWQTLGYMYEFDCKQKLSMTNLDKAWLAVAYEHHVGYVQAGTALQIQVCQGNPPAEDLVTTTSTSSSTIPTTSPTTRAPTTSTMSTTTTTKQKVTVSVMHTTETKTIQQNTSTTITQQTTNATKQTIVTHTIPKSTLQPRLTTTRQNPSTPKTTITTTLPTSTTTTTTITNRPPKSTTHLTTTTTRQTTTTTKATSTQRPTSTSTPSTTTTTQATTTPKATTTQLPKSTVTSSTTTSTSVAGVNPCTYVSAHHNNLIKGKLTHFGQNCYEFVSRFVTWNTAEQDCNKKEGYLVHIANAAEQHFIYKYLKTHIGNPIWIGLSDDREEGNFEWTSGDPVTYTNWSPSQHTLVHNWKDCVELDPNDDGSWKDQHCNDQVHHLYEYVCQYKPNASVPITNAPMTTDKQTILTNPQTTTTTRATTTQRPITTDMLSTTTTQLTPNVAVSPCTYVSTHHMSLIKGKLTHFRQNCYEFVSRSVKWNTAEHDCKSKEGHLVHIVNAAEQEFIYKYLNTHYGDRVWIGLTDHRDEGNFEWSSGDPVTYTHWSPNQYTFVHEGKDCVELDPNNNGFWKDQRCNNQHQQYYEYVCQYQSHFIEPVTNGPFLHTSTSVSYGLDGNVNLCRTINRQNAQTWNTHLAQYGSSCYELLPKQQMTWQHAEQLCQNGNGHLVDINSAAEQTFIQNFVKRYMPNNDVWIGLHDLNREGHYEWSSDKPVTYKHFINGHFGNFANPSKEDCVILTPYMGGKWDDIPCGNTDSLGDYGDVYPALCQFPIASTGSLVG